MIMWIFIALLTPIFHGFANILDNYLINKLFSKKVTLIFYSTFLNVIFLPFLFLMFGLPNLPNKQTFGLFFLISFINISYLYPYYKALQQNDTSIVTALFSLSKFFVPLLAFLIVHEVLSLVQYLGVIIVVISSIILNIESTITFRLNNSFWWMLGCTFILALETVLYKYTFLSVDWITGFAWPVILSFILILPILFIPIVRRGIFRNKTKFFKYFPVFVAEELCTFAGIGTGTYAISVAPVTIVETIGEIQVIFVLLYAKIFKGFFPKFFKENVTTASLRKKLVLFITIIIGVLLTLM